MILSNSILYQTPLTMIRLAPNLSKLEQFDAFTLDISNQYTSSKGNRYTSKCGMQSEKRKGKVTSFAKEPANQKAQTEASFIAIAKIEI